MDKGIISIVKWSISLLVISFIAYHISQKADLWQELIIEFKKATKSSYILLAVLGFMPINWWLESKKWQSLSHFPIQGRVAYKAVLAGVSVGLLTPNRVGEFGGRIAFVQKRDREAAVASSLIGSWSQLFCTILFGGMALALYPYLIQRKIFPNYFSIIGGVSLVVGLLVYFKSSKLIGVFHRIRFLQKFNVFFQVMNKYTLNDLVKAFFWSSARYLVFSIQLALLIQVFLPSHFNILLILIIPTFFIFQSIIPSIALAEIGVKGLILGYLLTMNTDSLEALIIGTVLWGINIALPALVGVFFILRTKVKE